MSKRFIFPQQNGERKKARLDVSISNHNFPLSQNIPSVKESNQGDNWGDDNDDEILLLASQACEQAYNVNDICSLPDYTICMQPPSTSTQMYNQPGPSTSNSCFTFKKPTVNVLSTVTSNLKSKCDRISSPLPGIAKVVPNLNDLVSYTDDLIFSDKICKEKDNDYLYRQLLTLQEENAKLKSENGRLSEKCVTKEGEASILRTQLKSCQVAVDNARLDRIKAQEKAQQEWTEKLTSSNNQLRDLRTQLDFKNLEIISVKEKCRMLESSKVKLTQVTVPSSEISRLNGTVLHNDINKAQTRHIKTSATAVQTENKTYFMKLNKSYRSETSELIEILPFILEPTCEQHSILDCNDKLQSTSNFDMDKCRIFSTFHRVPPRNANEESDKGTVALSSIYEDLSYVATGTIQETLQKRYFNILNTIKTAILEVQKELNCVSQRLTTPFQREMDERYIEFSAQYITVEFKDLVCGRSLYKEEQGILARRMTAMLAAILETSRSIEVFNNFEVQVNVLECKGKFIDLFCKICNLLDSNTCAVLYSGLLLSTTILVDKLYTHVQRLYQTKIIDVIKCIITCRAVPFVYVKVLEVVRRLALSEGFLNSFCRRNSSGNLRVDYDQGVLLYKKDSCLLQVLLKQIEMCLKCIDNQNLSSQAIAVTQNLIGLYTNINCGTVSFYQEKSCDCRLVLVQTIVYALHICAGFLKNEEHSLHRCDLLSVCRSGIQVAYQCSLRDLEFSSQLLHNEGHLIEFCELMRSFEHSDIYVSMLSELAGAFQAPAEEAPPPPRRAWLDSFDAFSIAD